MDRYIWVKHCDGAPFRKEINEKLEEGYKLHGPLIHAPGVIDRYTQAMIMPKEKWKLLNGGGAEFYVSSRSHYCSSCRTNISHPLELEGYKIVSETSSP